MLSSIHPPHCAVKRARATGVVRHTPPGYINLLVLDQFEELFTQADPDQRQVFCTLLAGLPAFAELRTHLIATLRADYLPDLFALRALYDTAKQGIDLRAMSVAELTAAIQQPLQVRAAQDARYQGKRWGAALVERLAHDAAPDAAYLPLLQVTLEMLWARGRLQLSAYGTLTDAIKQRAEAVYGYIEDTEGRQHRRPPTEQAPILALLLALGDVSLDAETQREVRRRRRRVDLEDGSAERRRLIDELVSARLLSIMVETEGGDAD